MKRTLYTLILGVLALSSYADIRTGWMVYGRSINSFTFERIKGTVVELMLTDSTVVQAAKALLQNKCLIALLFITRHN